MHSLLDDLTDWLYNNLQEGVDGGYANFETTTGACRGRQRIAVEATTVWGFSYVFCV